LLAAYLEGIAVGSLLSRAICLRRGLKTESRLRLVSGLAMAASLFGFLVVPLMARMVQHVHYVMSLPIVAVSAALLGALFPLTTHLAVVPDGRAGSRISLLYFANIIGSTGGTALVGFVLMDYWSLHGISVFLLVLGLALGGSIYASTLQGTRRYIAWGGAAAVALAGVLSAGCLFDRTYERMLFKSDYAEGYRFVHLMESKSGVVAVGPDGTVFGGGIYDGRFHTSLVNDTNALLRAYAISAFHPDPKQVLMIGLASGSWAQVIVNNPAVEHLTVVEINPDYLKLISQYPEVASILHNKKITIEIDDGRRWLFRHQESRFDLIVMNTTYNWRAHITNLLSVEFLQLVRRRLRDGGVLYYNTTGSEEVLLTGTSQFPYALRVLNFLALSDRPLIVDKEAWRRTLVSYRLDGKPVLDLTRRVDRARLDEVLATANSLNAPVDAATASMEYGPTIRARCQNRRVITDDNMGTEWDLN
jgi:predicted membrane-bound spermidine synthase